MKAKEQEEVCRAQLITSLTVLAVVIAVAVFARAVVYGTIW